MKTPLAIAVLIAAAVPAAGAALDATLLATDGRPVRVAAYRGKPAVLFYEDRASTDVNRTLKERLFARGSERGLLDRAHVIAVADIRAYDFFPARRIALAYLRRLEPRLGIPLLVDVDGTLSAAPWDLPSGTPSVLVLDAEGQLVLVRHGRLSDAEVEGVLGRLEGVIAGEQADR